MTEAQRINEEAAIDAKNNFLAIDKQLDKLKSKIHNFHFKDPKMVNAVLWAASGGFFLGSRRHYHLRWLLHLLSGGAFALTSARLYLDMTGKRTEETVKESQPKIQIHPSEPQHTIVPETRQLHNVRVIEPDYSK